MKSTRKVPLGRYVATFIWLMLFWLFLSGHYDVFHITIGVLCCAGIAWTSTDLLYVDQPDKKRTVVIAQFLIYIFWLLWQIILANFQVACLVLSPKLKIDPRIIVYRADRLRGDVAKATFGNSITLTPGTVTLDIHGNDFHVHALTPGFAADLEAGDMERWIAKVYH
jgi:multicomponent Na+:H+ antiporter subunit E